MRRRTRANYSPSGHLSLPYQGRESQAANQVRGVLDNRRYNPSPASLRNRYAVSVDAAVHGERRLRWHQLEDRAVADALILREGEPVNPEFLRPFRVPGVGPNVWQRLEQRLLPAARAIQWISNNRIPFTIGAVGASSLFNYLTSTQSSSGNSDSTMSYLPHGDAGFYPSNRPRPGWSRPLVPRNHPGWQPFIGGDGVPVVGPPAGGGKLPRVPRWTSPGNDINLPVVIGNLPSNAPRNGGSGRLSSLYHETPANAKRAMGRAGFWVVTLPLAN